MKQAKNILKLRKQGKSYNEIQKILNCSKGLISYHCGIGQKEKNKKRAKKSWKTNLSKKLCNFKQKQTSNFKKQNSTNWQNAFKTKIVQYIHGKHKMSYKTNSDVNLKSVLNKLGTNPKCYLTGRPIDLTKTSTYHFDHRIPKSKGGNSDLENLEITYSDINQAKSDKTPEEFIALCKEVLEFNGYSVNKI